MYDFSLNDYSYKFFSIILSNTTTLYSSYWFELKKNLLKSQYYWSYIDFMIKNEYFNSKRFGNITLSYHMALDIESMVRSYLAEYPDNTTDLLNATKNELSWREKIKKHSSLTTYSNYISFVNTILGSPLEDTVLQSICHDIYMKILNLDFSKTQNIFLQMAYDKLRSTFQWPPIMTKSTGLIVKRIIQHIVTLFMFDNYIAAQKICMHSVSLKILFNNDSLICNRDICHYNTFIEQDQSILSKTEPFIDDFSALPLVTNIKKFNSESVILETNLNSEPDSNTHFLQHFFIFCYNSMDSDKSYFDCIQLMSTAIDILFSTDDILHDIGKQEKLLEIISLSNIDSLIYFIENSKQLLNEFNIIGSIIFPNFLENMMSKNVYSNYNCDVEYYAIEQSKTEIKKNLVKLLNKSRKTGIVNLYTTIKENNINLIEFLYYIGNLYHWKSALNVNRNNLNREKCVDSSHSMLADLQISNSCNQFNSLHCVQKCVHRLEDDFDVIEIPPVESIQISEADCIPISNLPMWTHSAFSNITKLNYIQSTVFEAVFNGNQNILISAPTGSGKTNIGLLGILHHISILLKSNENCDISSKFEKIIYIAPLKCLATEVAQKYSQALKSFNLLVKEYTGDVIMTKNEFKKCHVIVTVPEKWDILTRNIVTGGFLEKESSLFDISTLIIDEIHILNEERGPVIEAIVARTFLYSELTQKLIRIISFSATLPNLQDVADFLRVKESNIFNFNDKYRPIPLRQSIVGIKHKDGHMDMSKYNLACYLFAMDHIVQKRQVLIFVHSREDTRTTAEMLISLFSKNNKSHYLINDMESSVFTNDSQVQKSLLSSKHQALLTLLSKGIGTHHAGMLRTDRDLVEMMFKKGYIKVIITTATLAWGVNFPARCVIIKGTSVYNTNSRNLVDLGILDVIQIFGRAGRPQFDSIGEAVLITSHNKMSQYISRLSNKVPLESQLTNQIPSMLNAEIVIGSITNESEGVRWLGSTFFFIRVLKSPLVYGLTQEYLKADPNLVEYRRDIIMKSADFLENKKLVRITRYDSSYHPTELGRITAKCVNNIQFVLMTCFQRFYLDPSTGNDFYMELCKNIVLSDKIIIGLIANSYEFQNIKVKRPEVSELSTLYQTGKLFVPLNKGIDLDEFGFLELSENKISILIQAFVLRLPLYSSSLTIDSYYIQTNAVRLLRALLTISFSNVRIDLQVPSSSIKILEWCKMLERQLCSSNHIMRHFCDRDFYSSNSRIDKRCLSKKKNKSLLNLDSVIRLEEKKLDLEHLLELTKEEIYSIIGTHYQSSLILKLIKKVPILDIDLRIRPITSGIINILIKLTQQFEWDETFHNKSESYWLWIEDPNSNNIMHCEKINVKKPKHVPSSDDTDGNKSQCVSEILIPLPDSDSPSQFILFVVSDKWLGLSHQIPFSVSHLILPQQKKIFTPLLKLFPLSTSCLNDINLKSLYRFNFFNPIQTQFFHTLYHTDNNVLLGAPTGSGKTVAAELAMFRFFKQQPKSIAVYIAPMKALVKERISDWKSRIESKLGKKVSELTGDFTPDINILKFSNVIVTTPEKWDGISRQWQRREYVRRVGLLIIDEIHLLGMERGSILEVIISRTKYIENKLNQSVRLIGLSTALSNSYDISMWLGVKKIGHFNFHPSVRPVPCEIQITGFPEKHYCPRMGSMNKPAFKAIQSYGENRPVLIFVSSRRQTRLTALDLIRLSTSDESYFSKPFIMDLVDIEIENIINSVKDTTLKHTLSFGIALHHAGLSENDRLICENLFRESKIQIMISTSTLAWGVNLPAHLVIIKGTEVYDASKKGYVDIPITDVLQMVGRAGRPQFDTSAKACVYVHTPKKDFYQKFLYQSFPVESSLYKYLDDHLNAEISSKTITNYKILIDYIEYTYFYKRLVANPQYYDEQQINYSKMTPINSFEAKKHYMYSGERTKDRSNCLDEKKRISTYLMNLLDSCLQRLVDRRCLYIETNKINDDSMIKDCNNLDLKKTFISTELGHIGSTYYVSTKTIAMADDIIKSKSFLTWLDMTYLLSQCQEYSNLPMRHNEDKINEKLSELCPVSIDLSTIESSHTKAFILFQTHFFYIPLPIVDYVTDLKSVLDQSIRCVQAFMDIAELNKKLMTSLHCCILLQCLIQGGNPFRHTLSYIPYCNDDLLKNKLENSKIKTLAELVYSSAEEQTKFVKQLFPLKFDEIFNFIKKIPVISVKILISQNHTEQVYTVDAINTLKSSENIIFDTNDNVTINVVLFTKDNPNHLVSTTSFTKKKEPGWICLAGIKESDHLIKLKRFPPLRYSKEQKVYMASANIYIPSNVLSQYKNSNVSITIMVISDCIRGIDQELNFGLTIH